MFRYLNCWTNMALLTCRKSELMELRCSLPFVTAIEHGSRGTRRNSFNHSRKFGHFYRNMYARSLYWNCKSIILKTIKVSGTIRGCQREMKRIHESAILKETNAELRNKMAETKTEFDDRMEQDDWLLTCCIFLPINCLQKYHKWSTH